jgi:sugar phosphate permease
MLKSPRYFREIRGQSYSRIPCELAKSSLLRRFHHMTKMNAASSSMPKSSRLISRLPLFYGWVIMVVGTIGMIMTSPGQTYAVSIFIERFINDLGISRTTVSTLYTAGTLMGSLALPMIGRQIDRRGPRQMVVAISIVFGLGCVFMGFVRNALMLLIGFTIIRMFGQGSLGLASSNVINQWWVRRRGMIMGISGVLVSLLALGGFPNLINWLIPLFGWRITYAILGLSLLLFMAPVGYLLFRDSPEDYGLQPDGDRVDQTIVSKMVQIAEENWLPSEAIRTLAFWSIAAGMAAIAMLATGLFFHMVSIIDDNGLSTSVAAAIYVPIALTTAIINLGSGSLVNRIPIRVLLAGALVLQAVSLTMAQFLKTVEIAFIYGIILGATSGLIRTVGGVAWASYFGRRHLGSISGLASTIMVAGSALGPMPLGIARDWLGSYNQALTIFAVLPLLLAILALMAKAPVKSPQKVT